MKKIVLAISVLLFTPLTLLFAEAGRSAWADSKKKIESAVKESVEEAESRNEKQAWREFKKALAAGRYNVAKDLLKEEGVAENINKRILGMPPLVYVISEEFDLSAPQEEGDLLTPKQKAKQNEQITALALAIIAMPQTDLNKSDHHYRTALHWGVYKKDRKIIKALLTSQRQGVVKVDPIEDHGWTPLQLAAENGDVNIIKRLLKSGADINHANLDKWTVLMIAAANAREEAVKELLYPSVSGVKGADINAVNKDGETALMKAIDAGSYESVEELLGHPKIDVLIRDNHGQKALTHAQLLKTKRDLVGIDKNGIIEMVKVADKKAKEAAKAAKKSAKQGRKK